MDNPANPTVVNEPPWHVTDTPASPDSPRGGAGASLGGPASPGTSPGGPAEPPVSGPEPSAPSEIPPKTPVETSLPPLPPPPPLPSPTGGFGTPFVIKPASPGASLGGPASTTGVKPPKEGGGGKAVLASLIFFLIAITTGIGFYFFQKGGLPFNLGKKAAPGACCTYGGSPTGCAANENCVNDQPAAQQAGCTYPYVCKPKVTTWATQNCADIWYNGGYGNIPSDAQCCCRIVNPGSPCDEDCRFANEASYNSSMGTVIQFCDASSNPWRPSWQSRDNTDCDEKGYCSGIDDPLIPSGTCSVCNNMWRKPPLTPTPTPPTQNTPTPTPPTKITPTPTTPVTKITPTPTSTSTPTPTPPPLLCLKVEASKNGIILSNLTTDIVPGDIITIYVTAPYVTAPFGVTGFAVRIRTNGPPPIEHIAISSNPDEWLDFSLDCSQCVRWKYEYTIPAGGVGNYTIDGFVKSGGVWR